MKSSALLLLLACPLVASAQEAAPSPAPQQMTYGVSLLMGSAESGETGTTGNGAFGGQYRLDVTDANETLHIDAAVISLLQANSIMVRANSAYHLRLDERGQTFLVQSGIAASSNLAISSDSGYPGTPLQLGVASAGGYARGVFQLGRSGRTTFRPIVEAGLSAGARNMPGANAAGILGPYLGGGFGFDTSLPSADSHEQSMGAHLQAQIIANLLGPDSLVYNVGAELISCARPRHVNQIGACVSVYANFLGVADESVSSSVGFNIEMLTNLEGERPNRQAPAEDAEETEAAEATAEE